jgi:hypothetical protein
MRKMESQSMNTHHQDTDGSDSDDEGKYSRGLPEQFKMIVLDKLEKCKNWTTTIKCLPCRYDSEIAPHEIYNSDCAMARSFGIQTNKRFCQSPILDLG